jgi:hypothetical protein
MVFQSILRKLLLAIVTIAAPSDVSVLTVPRLVAETRLTSGSAVQAVSVAGKWQGTTGQGRQVTLELQADRSAVTGTLVVDDQSSAITDGKIERTTLSFKATLGGRTLTFAAEVAGDELTLAMEGAQNPVTLKRTK